MKKCWSVFMPFRFSLVCPSVRQSEKIVYHIAPKVYELASWKFIGMLVSMNSEAHGVLLADSFSNGRVITLNLVKHCTEIFFMA